MIINIKAKVFNDNYEFNDYNILVKNKDNSLVVTDEYIYNIIDNNECLIYSILDNMTKAKIFKSEDEAEQAYLNNIINAKIVIELVNDINNFNDDNYKKVYSLEDFEKYCNMVMYTYTFNTKKLHRMEMYGGPTCYGIERYLYEYTTEPQFYKLGDIVNYENQKCIILTTPEYEKPDYIIINEYELMALSNNRIIEDVHYRDLQPTGENDFHRAKDIINNESGWYSEEYIDYINSL